MSESSGVNWKGVLERGFTLAVGAVALGAVATVGSCGVNAVQSSAEFNGVQAQTRMLIEQGKLTDASTGAPKTHIVEYAGQKFAISINSALISQNGVYRDASGQQVQQSQTESGNGAVRSETYSSGYVINGVINRVEGSTSFFRPFYNDGGSRDFSLEWGAGKPPHAPMSIQAFNGNARQIPVPVVVQPADGGAAVAAPAAPAPAATPAG